MQNNELNASLMQTCLLNVALTSITDEKNKSDEEEEE